MQPDNPYASPTHETPLPVEAAVSAPLQLASQGQRFVNLIVDNIITWILSTVGGLVVGVAYALTRANPATPLEPEDEMSLQLIGYAVGLFVAVAYYMLTEGLFQRSLAKFITRTRVVTADGGRPTFGQILGRTLARFIPFEAFSFLGGHGFPIGWHDSLSGTRVVRT